MPKKIIFTDKAPKAIGPYSQAIQSGNLLFISGQIPFNPLPVKFPMISASKPVRC